MTAMSTKFNSLTAHAAGVKTSGVGSVVPLLNTPFDGNIAEWAGDERSQIIKDHADVLVGDIAYAGNNVGVVTQILTADRIEVTFEDGAMQTPNASSVAKRVVEYTFVDGANADADGTNVVENPNAISGIGVVFVRVIS